MAVKVSVIIPCYNQGNYVGEAVDSVLAQTYRNLEIIIVNDGSTDEQTGTILESFQGGKTSVITTGNQGLAAARNTGIAAAAGEYILPLDADDRIAPSYIEQGVSLLDRESAVGIVYSRAMLFGAVTCEWNLPRYSLQEMLRDNIIFCSALFRRSDWEAVGGYDTGMVYGWEDYDFWLSLIERGREVRQLDAQLFFYRVLADSMVRTKEKWQKIEMFTRIYHRHQAFFSSNIATWIENLVDVREPYFNSRLYVDNGSGFNETDSISRKVTRGEHRVSFDVSQFASPRNYRFDPIDCSAYVRVEQVVLRDSDGKKTEIDVATLASNAVCRNTNLFMFSDPDPQIGIPVVEAAGKHQSLEIRFTVVSVGEDSLRDIIDYQKGAECRTISARVKRWWRSSTAGRH